MSVGFTIHKNWKLVKKSTDFNKQIIIPKEEVTGNEMKVVYLMVKSEQRASYLIRAKITDNTMFNEISPGTVENGVLEKSGEIRQHLMSLPNNGIGIHNFNVKLRIMSGSANL